MINQNFEKLPGEYLFKEIAVRTESFVRRSGREVINMGIGDVTLPLTPAVVEAAAAAAAEMARPNSFKGYGDYNGYEFLRQAICRYYAPRVNVALDEVFVSDGAKSDIYHLTDLFKGTALVPDPVYPVYRDSNVIAGNRIVFAGGGEQNGFLPAPPAGARPDFIYLCSPSNPCGEAYDYDGLKQWVDYALDSKAYIIYDAAYESYIRSGKPRSIFEISGAEECAVEVNSLSKSAGFTGVRCGWTIIKNERLKTLWLRRQSSAFNGVGYIVSRMAEAALCEQGIRALGYKCYGGVDSPYVFTACGNSWKFFDKLLNAGVVVTPGAGFGLCGEGYVRLTGFANRQNTIKACEVFRQELGAAQ